MLGIRTQGRKMVGADETTEQWRIDCNKRKNKAAFEEGIIILLDDAEKV